MLTKLDCIQSQEDFDGDVTVVGAGAVGLVMAKRLADRGMKVIVLEAGGETVTPHSQACFTNAKSVGANLEGLHVGRFRAVGGTTNFWGGQLVEFDANTFEPREQAGPESAWPATREELMPYYRAVLEVTGHKSMLLDDSDVFRRLGIEVSDWGRDVDIIATRWLREPNFARLFRADIEKHPNLRVITDAQVTGFTMGSDRQTVVAVEAVAPSGHRRMIPVRQVVLANGTIEIARLLASTAADDPDLPWSANAWIGRGFMDHIDCVAGDVTILDRKRFHTHFDNGYIDGLKYSPKLKLSEQAQVRFGVLQVAGLFAFRSSFADHIASAKIFVKSILRGRLEKGARLGFREFLSMIRVGTPMVLRYLRYNRMYNPADLGVQLRVSAEQKMVRESGLRLRTERDALGVPMIDIDWKIDGIEIETIARFAECVRDRLAALGLADLAINPLLAARDPRFLEAIDDANHHMGMARMSASAIDGVVDRDLCVHGSRNLYVAGAAVFPSTGFANPTFTAMALGLRLCDKLSTAAS